MSVLTGNTPASDYGNLLNIGNNPTGTVGLTNVLQSITDGYGTQTPLSISTVGFNVSRSGATFTLDSVAVTAQAVDINSMCQPNPVALGTGSLKLPVGTTSDRPLAPLAGMNRYNSQTGFFEGYTGSTWVSFTDSGGTISSITGTPNQITTAGTSNVVLAIADNPIIPGTASITIPTGTTGQRPLASMGGQVRYNTTLHEFEYFSDLLSAWVQPVTEIRGITNEIDVIGTNPTVLGLSSTLIFPGTAALDNGNDLAFFDSTGIGYAAIKAPTATYNANITYQLPVAGPPGNGYVLACSTAGVMSWIVAATGSVTSVSGTTNEINSTGGTTPVLSLSSTLIFPGTAALDNGNDLAFFDSTGIGFAAIKAPIANYAANVTYQLPVNAPAVSGYVLSSDTSGVLSWVANTAGSVVSVSGTANQITSTGGTTPVIGIASDPIIPGTGAITVPVGTTLQQPGAPTAGMFRYNSDGHDVEYYNAFTSTWEALAIQASIPTYPLSLQLGGTNADLSAAASLGGIVYSTATAFGILGGTATARQMLQSGASAAPAWSTSTWPATTTINRLLYSSANNVVSEVATANSAVLVTTSAGVPGYTSTMTNGQLVIGSTGNTPTVATLTAGTGIAITNGAGSISIATTGGATVSQNINQNSHGFSVGNVLYYNGSSYVKAQANAASTAEVVGIVSVVIDANNFTLFMSGYLSTLSGLTAGTVYFLSDSVAGGYSSTEPSTVGYISRPLFVAVSTTAAIVANFRGKIIPANGYSITWNSATTSSITLSAYNGYACNNGASLITFTIPATAAVGDTYIIAGNSSGGWKLQANTGQVIHVGSTASSTAGSASSQNQYDAINVVCVVANTTFVTYSMIGNLTVV